MGEKRRFREMDMLRGIAILMVLLYHSIIVFPINLHETAWCYGLHRLLWTIQMPLFFLVSGFVFSCGDNYRDYLGKKCRRILVPHIVFSVLDILPRIIPNPLVHEQMGGKEAVTEFLIYGGSDWFLRTLFLISVIFPVFYRIMRKGGIYKISTVIFIVLLFIFRSYVTDFLLFKVVCGYLIYFLAGWILRGYWGAISEKVRACGFGRLLQKGKDGKVANFLEECGKWSLQMYLLDAYALVATRTVFVSIMGISDPVVIIAGNFICDTAIVFFVSRHILTKAKVFRVLCGIPEKVGYAV